MDTREWTDGVLTSSARQVVKETSLHSWIVCDGDIDPEWIESLNSVLDDNRYMHMYMYMHVHTCLKCVSCVYVYAIIISFLLFCMHHVVVM